VLFRSGVRNEDPLERCGRESRREFGGRISVPAADTAKPVISDAIVSDAHDPDSDHADAEHANAVVLHWSDSGSDVLDA